MIFNIDKNSPAIIRFIPTSFISFSIHYIKDKKYSCENFNNKTEICPICEMRKNLYQDAINAKTEKIRKEHNEFARTLRPIEKHFIPIIDRNDLNQGVQILSVSKSLFQIILNGWLKHPCPPPKELKWYQFYQRFINYQYPISALDENQGVDFILRKEVKRTGCHVFLSYEKSTYTNTRSPISKNIKELKKWKIQAKEMLNKIVIPSAKEITKII